MESEDLPQELVGEIIDNTSTDIDSLRALSLTAHSFLAFSQKQIFSSLEVSTLRMNQWRQPSPSQADKLLALLKASPHLAGYTTHLTVYLDHEPFLENGTMADEELTVAAFLPLFRDLTRFSLKLRNLSWHALSRPLIEAAHGTLKLPTLVHADFQNIPFDIVQKCALSLKCLALLDPIPSVHALIVHPQSRQLDSLLIEGTSWAKSSRNAEAIQQVLQSGLDLSRLRKLAVNVLSCKQDTHYDIFKLLQACAGSLEVFSFSPSLDAFLYSTTPNVEPINLGILTSLRVLHLSVQAGIPPHLNELEPIEWIVSLFSKIPESNHLEKIIISSTYHVMPTVYGTNFFGVDFDFYPRLRDVITVTRFPRLRGILFYTEDQGEDMRSGYPTPPYDGIVTWINSCMEKEMKPLRGRGILELSSGLPFRHTLFPPDAGW